MQAISPEMVWISPHAPKKDSSWKIPLVLRAIQLLFWKNARLVGADTERFPALLHQKLSVDRQLPLQQREWSAYRLLRGPSLSEIPPKITFISEIAERRTVPRLYDLVIHPGANAKNRMWPIEKYAPLVAFLPSSWRIAFLGLPSDMALIKAAMPSTRPYDYVTGSIRQSIQTLASARMLLLMDSGNMHFAQILGVPSVAVFGYTDPADIIDINGCVATIYEQRFPCQPCKKAVCSQPEIYCLNSIEPETVALKLMQRWETILEQEKPRHGLVHILNS